MSKTLILQVLQPKALAIFEILVRSIFPMLNFLS